MKKILSLILCLILCFSMFSCNSRNISNEENSSKITSNTTPSSTSTEQSQNITENNQSSDKDNISNKEYTEIPVTLSDGKIIFPNQAILRVSILRNKSLSSTSSSVEEYDTTTLVYQSTIKKITKAVKDLKLSPLPDDYRVAYSTSFEIRFYFSDNTYLCLSLHDNLQRVVINGTSYLPEDPVQITNIADAFSWPYTNITLEKQTATIGEDGKLIFSNDVKGIEISKIDFDERGYNYGYTSIKYSHGSIVADEFVDIPLITQAFKEAVFTKKNNDTVPSTERCTCTEFKFNFTGDDAVGFYFVFEAISIDGNIIFHIGDNYYTIDDTQLGFIENAIKIKLS